MQGPLYPVLDLIYPELSEGALVAADNVLYPDFWQNETATYRRHVRRQPGIEAVLLSVGSGIDLSFYARQP